MRELGSEAFGDGELQAIGTIVVNFTDLDFAAGHLLEGCISGDVAFLLVAGEDIRWKLDKLRVIADNIVSDEPAAQLLRAWVCDAKVVVDRRNQLMHSFYMTADGGDAISRWKVSTRGGTWKGHQESVVLADLEGFADLIALSWHTAEDVEERLRACGAWHDHAVTATSE